MFINSYSRYTCVYLLENKSQVFKAFLEYKVMIEKHSGKLIVAKSFYLMPLFSFSNHMASTIDLHVHILTPKMVEIRENTGISQRQA